MVTTSMLLVYLAPPALVLSFMITGRTSSFHHLGSLRRLQKTITREDWLAVYEYLVIGLESGNGPRETKPTRPWRPMGSGMACLGSVALLFVPIPLDLPLSFAQYSWNAFPVIQVALAGGMLASSFILAFHRTKGWLLLSNPPAEYPHLGWASPETAQTKKGKK